MSLFRGMARLPFTARIERYTCPQACSFSLQGWGLIDLPLRASNEGSPRPRVARAQKIIRLHPPFCPSLRASNERDRSKRLIQTCSFLSHGMAPVLNPLRPSNEHILIVRVPGAQDQRGCPSSFSSCGLREHRKPSNLPSHAPSTFTPPLTGGWPAWAPTARVQRAPSERARCASTGGQQTTLPFFFTLDRGTHLLAMILTI